jgi:uncharacterized SAM-binding protein YcdF (DUF218 family)
LLRAIWLASFMSAALAAGFVVFASYVSVMPNGASQPADGIVALTGDEDRISEAVRLLAEGKAGRLLISGVNKSTSSPQIINLARANRNKSARSPQVIDLAAPSHAAAILFRCCVDLDKRALNTEDNAAETTIWARQRGFRSLILVTSTYHMPRALIELRQSMPDAEIIPYPVKSSRLETEWWSDPQTSWVLAKEYLKFLTASIRYAASSLTGPEIGRRTQKRTIDALLG